MNPLLPTSLLALLIAHSMVWAAPSLLLDNLGTDPEEIRKEVTERLVAASCDGRALDVEILLSVKPAYLDINRVAKNGLTPLVCAIQNDRIEVMRLLMDLEGERLDYNRAAGAPGARPPLVWAAQGKNPKITELLLTQKSKIRSDAQDSTGDTAWHVAANVEQLRILLNSFPGFPLEFRNHAKNTPLTFAFQRYAGYLAGPAMGVSRDFIQTLLHSGRVDVNAAGVMGRTPLHMIAECGNRPQGPSLSECMDLMRELLSLGANPGAEDSGGNTPTSKLIDHRWCSLEPYKALLQAGAKFDSADSSGVTLVMKALYPDACKAEKLPLIRFLLSSGASAKAVDNQGKSVLFYIGDYKPRGNQELLDVLLSAGADINRPDQTGVGYVELVLKGARSSAERALDFKFLLERGADLNFQSPDGKTILMRSISDRNLVEELFKHGANLNLVDRDGNTALHLFLNKPWDPSDRYRKESLEHLLLLPFEIGIQNREGLSPLMMVVDSEVVRLLLSRGADPNLKDTQGDSLLHRLLKTNSYVQDTFEALLEAGADPSATDSHGWNVLMRAMERYPGHIPFFPSRLKGKVDFNFENPDHETALIIFLKRVQSFRETGFTLDNQRWLPDVVGALLEGGARPDARTGDGKTTAFSLALQVRSLPTLGLLIQAGARNELDDLKPVQSVPDAESPINACLDWNVSAGWKVFGGGCQSPDGFVWSVDSGHDRCVRNARGQIECKEEESTRSVKWEARIGQGIQDTGPARYCRQRGFELPSFELIAKAWLTGLWNSQQENWSNVVTDQYRDGTDPRQVEVGLIDRRSGRFRFEQHSRDGNNLAVICVKPGAR